MTDRIQIGNVGRGYVLKRILRRGVRFGKQFLHLPNGFFARLVSVVISLYGSAFPELIADGNEKYVTTAVTDEENAFLANWVQGEQQFLKIVERVKKSGATVIPGEDAAFLYQTGGFPVDLTRIMAEGAGMTVDEKGFEAAQKKHVEASKGETKVGDGSTKTIVLETAHMALLNKEMKIPGTDDSVKYELGEEGKAVSSTIQAMFDGSIFMDEISEGQNIGIVMGVTPFYAEQGGQVSDIGTLTTSTGATLEILDCKKYGQYTLHQGVVRSGSFKVGDSIEANVDMTVRNAILPNHTMTHILNLGLRNVLPQDQVDQKGMFFFFSFLFFIIIFVPDIFIFFFIFFSSSSSGSLNDTKKLRFDFNCRKAVSADQLQKVEAIVRAQIEAKHPVHCKVVPLASAMQITSLRAVFGETYPDPVRVVSVGKSVEDLLADPTNPEWQKYSIELCGGTHVPNTSFAEAFVISEESGTAKGIRRVTCLTGAPAKKAIEDGEKFAARIAAALKLAPEAMMKEQKELEKVMKGDGEEGEKLVCSVYLKETFAAELKRMHKLGSSASAAAGNDLIKAKAEEAKTTGYVLSFFGFFIFCSGQLTKKKKQKTKNKKQICSSLFFILVLCFF